MNFIKEERTNIIPLRWFANGCEKIAHFFLQKYMKWNDLDWERRRGSINMMKFYSKLADIFYTPYMKWGTWYKADIDD